MTDAVALPALDFSDLGTPQGAAPVAVSPPDFSDMGSPLHPSATSSGNLATDAGRFIGTAGANALAGLVSMPRTVAQGVDWAGSWAGLNPGADDYLASLHDPTDPTKPAFPDFQQGKELAFGTTGGTEYVPTSLPGRLGMAATTGGLMAAANPASIPAAMAGSTTSELAGELFPSHPTLARLAGFIPGSWLGNRVAQTGAQVAGAAMGNEPNATAQAYARQGVPTTLNGDVSGDPSLRFAQTFAARMPGGEDMIAEAQDKALTGFADAVDRASSRLGTAVTAQDAGQSLQTGLKNWKTQQQAQQNTLWNDFHSQVPSDSRVDVSNYQKTLGQLALQPSSEQAAVAPLASDTAQNLQSGLGDALGPDGKLSWGTVRTIRTQIGKLLDGRPGTVDVDNAGLKQLYGALSQDMQGAAANTSPSALTAFYRANAATSAFHDMLDSGVSNVLNAQTPEAAAQYALSQARLGGSRVGAVTLAAGPEASGNLAAYQLNRMAGSDGTTPASPTSFATANNGKRPVLSPEARSVLFGDPKTSQDIADLTTIGKSLQGTQRAANTSGTAAHETRGMGRVIAAGEMAKAGHEMAGVPGAIAGGALGLA